MVDQKTSAEDAGWFQRQVEKAQADVMEHPQWLHLRYRPCPTCGCEGRQQIDQRTGEPTGVIVKGPK